MLNEERDEGSCGVKSVCVKYGNIVLNCGV